MIQWKERFWASGIHLCISALVAALAGLLVFAVWFPFPYREVSGGRELFLLVIMVDVMLGPLITLAVFNRAKPRAELRRDLTVVAVLQIAGLLYGLWSVSLARPVHLVFEIDRFRVVHAVDVPEPLLGRTPSGIDALPWFGPTLLAVRPFNDQSESLDATMAALEGTHIGARPDLWQPYVQARARVQQAAKPVVQLKRRLSGRAGEIDALLKAAGRSAERTAYLPLVARRTVWTVFIDPATAEVVAFMPLDPF